MNFLFYIFGGENDFSKTMEKRFLSTTSFFVKLYYKYYLLRLFIKTIQKGKQIIYYMFSTHKREPYSISSSFFLPRWLNGLPWVCFPEKDMNFTFSSLHKNEWVSILRLEVSPLRNIYQPAKYNLKEEYVGMRQIPSLLCKVEDKWRTVVEKLFLAKFYFSEKICCEEESIKNEEIQILPLQATEKPSKKYFYLCGFHIFKGKKCHGFPEGKSPEFPIFSKVHFLTVLYLHPKLREPIDITVPSSYFVVDNEIYSPAFVFRCLQYQPYQYYFDKNYTLQIIDQDINIFELKSNEYICIEKDNYKICFL